MVTSISIIEANKETKPVIISDFKIPTFTSNNSTLLLEWILYIYYPIFSTKDYFEIYVLINLESKINIITLAYISKPGLKV